MAEPSDTATGGAQDASPRPYDTLDDSEREEIQAKIIKHYFDTFQASTGGVTSGAPNDKLITSWQKLIQAALIQTTEFQEMALNEYQTPGTHRFSDAHLKREWVIGVVLPGFYDHFGTFDEGFDSVLASLNDDIIFDGHSQLRKSIAEGEGGLVSEATKTRSGEPRTPVYPTKNAIAQLFLIAQDEKTLDYKRSITYDHLQSLGNTISGMNAANKLLARYQTANNPDTSETSIDVFGKAVRDSLPNWAKFDRNMRLPPIEVDEEDFDSKLQQSLTEMEFVEAGTDEYADLTTAAGDPGSAKIEGISADIHTFDKPVGGDVLAAEVAKAKAIPTYPQWIPPTTGCLYFEAHPAHSLSQFDSQEGAVVSVSKTAAKGYKNPTGFRRSRMISNKNEEREVRPTVRQALEKACKYMRGVSHKEAEHFNKRSFNAEMQAFAKAAKRDAGVTDLPSTSSKLRGFSELLKLDDWWHVRCLFKAVGLVMGKEVGVRAADYWRRHLNTAELEIASLLAMVSGGALDPLPWIIAIEARMRELWKLMKSHFGAGAPDKIRVLFTEAALWVNATAVNAFILRTPSGSKGRDIAKTWYKQLFEYNPHCANTECLRILPHPSRVTTQWIRGVFSVGTREARIGRRVVRNFISSNRDTAYDCLFEILRCFEPCEETIILIFWYSHLYHDNHCKAIRGKHTVNAF